MLGKVDKVYSLEDGWGGIQQITDAQTVVVDISGELEAALHYVPF